MLRNITNSDGSILQYYEIDIKPVEVQIYPNKGKTKLVGYNGYDLSHLCINISSYQHSQRGTRSHLPYAERNGGYCSFRQSW